MKQLIIISILLVFVTAQTYSTTDCTCAQLLSEGDCTRISSLNCAWDATNKKCATSQTTTPTVETYAAYCDSFNQTDCPATNGCAWVSEKCTFFTGCTPFAKTTDADCQAISTKCITDGTHCVEKNTCNNFLKALPCVKNAAGDYCYWDTTNNVCVDANTCDKLPVSLTTDTDCRAKISTCTAKTGGGCQDSGINCSDQTTDISCVWNKAKNIACLWTGTACVDRTCANAPTSLTTDDACKSFRTDGTCTTKSGGGCVTRSTCSAATIQAACVTSSTGSICYWNGTACVDKTCANAPNTMTTNTACAGFLSNCITTGTGCINNGACSVATIEAACVKNLSGSPCIWNVTCKDKTCGNAPTSNNTHDLCTTYLASCTVASGGSGCQTRTCANAPTTITTNEACETYLPGAKCVAKAGGGCVTNGVCSSLGQVACVKDASGNDCFWNGTGCVDKICTQALATNTTHGNCQSYMTKCTVNSTSAGCVDYTCENALTPDICTTNYDGKPCIYKGKCYQKQCALAPSNSASHSECQSYHVSCTLSNAGAGCVPIPLRCQAITIKDACYVRKSSSGTANCGWNGTQCIDRDCTTLDKTFTTTAQCSGATGISGCVSANPVGGAVTGCIALPSTCAARQSSDNCEQSGSVSCIWNSGTCVTKSCSTATIAGTTGVLLTVSQSNCAGYLTGCTVSNDGTSCIAKLTACSGYTSASNCIDGAKSTGGDCYWNSGTCVDKVCANITLTTHGACNGVLNTCTVNAAKSSCMSFAACNTYTLQEQCVTNSSNKACTWTGIACRDRVCTDAPSTASYDSVSDCEGYTVSTGTCAVIPRVISTGGCMARQASCTSYYESATCLTDSSSNTCFWHNGKCYLQSAFSCSDIGGVTFDLAGCQAVSAGCKGNLAGTACISKVCSDYSTQNKLPGGTAVSTDAHCSTLDTTCTIDLTAAAVKCQTKAAACSGYIAVGTCTYSAAGQCYWNGTTCVLQSTITTCAGITHLGTWDDANCESVLYSCKVNGTNDGCVAKDCADYTKTDGKSTGSTAVSTHAHCQALNTSCTIDLTGGTGVCQDISATCNYTPALKCTVSSAGQCMWNGTACGLKSAFTSCASASLSTWDDANCESVLYSCKVNGTNDGCVAKACADYTKTDGKSTGSTAVSTDAHCSSLDTSCTIDLTGGTGVCQTRQATCSLYTASPKCTKATEGNCIWNSTGGASGTGACELISATNCNLKTGSGLTDTDCATHNAACIANRAGTACQVKQSTCSAYASLANCTRTSTVECIGTGDASGTCTAVTATTACTSIFVGTGSYTHALCNLKNTTCTVNAGSTACTAKVCSNATSAGSFSDCNTWLSSCTWNGTSTCVTISATCAAQTTSACYQATEGDCHVIGSACVKKTCDNAPLAKNSDALCSAFLSTCTLARTGGCIPRAACSTYTTSSQCGNKNTTGGSCYWSTTSLSCVDLTCANIDQIASNNSHSACNTILNTCTVRASSGAAVNGCQSLGACSSYTIQDQCRTNASAGLCEWNTNLDTPACVDKSCTTAPNTKVTHADCLAYFGTNACTVAAVAGTGGAANTLGGCMPVGPCSSYIDAEQCKINASNQPCGWNGTVCADFSCTTAPSTNNTDALCQTHKSGCTVDQSGSGCMALLATCEAYQIEGNCKFNLTGAPCYWNSTTNVCVTRTCDNAPDTSASDSDCNTYLAGCTMDSVKCKTKICEDFQLATDALCRASLSKCTTDGTQCVLRGTCAQALSQAGCVTDSNDVKCEWIPASGSASAYCTVKTCATAPVDQYTTESQCSTYFTNCTTKNGGGCVIKTTCAAANVESACTVAADGTKCQWDTTANNCRNKDCQDYAGSSHSACQAINTTCTAGSGGFCAKVKSCANTTVRAACIKGSDGPCLWITDAAGVGACYPYTSCKSLNWNTHNSCKAISPNCTTNGTNCLGITLCSETNVSGGCVKGYDGDCIQSVASLGSTDAPVCKAYTSCTDAFYATHAACQTASSKCTTNGTTGCIPLGTCQSYTQPGCVKNAAGVVLTNGVITSTGACTWDNTASACRDQNCSDLVGANHYTCAAQLSTCTSDGTACLAQSTCSTYLQPACGIAQGTDGTCIWQAVTATVTTAVCRVMVCSDVSSGTTTAACAAGLSGCISNGTVCIAKANCSTYTTLTACNSGGLDGVCVFTASTATGAAAGTGTCALMTSCSQANNDQFACTQVKTRCSWTGPSGSGATAVASKCAAHTCASYQATNSVCGNFLNWAKTLQQVCSLKNGVCTETDPTTLAQADCYSVSKYTYTWNASTSKCGVCTTPPPATNNTTNPDNTTNSTTTDSGYILSFATVVLGYLMF